MPNTTCQRYFQDHVCKKLNDALLETRHRCQRGDSSQEQLDAQTDPLGRRLVHLEKGANEMRMAICLASFVGLFCHIEQSFARDIHKLFHDQSDWLVRDGLEGFLDQNVTYVGNKRKVNVLALADGGQIMNLKTWKGWSQINPLSGDLQGKPLPDPRADVNPSGLRYIDNTRPLKLRDNSQDVVLMKKGLCFCEDPVARKRSCGGIPNSIEGMTAFLMENARVLNKENPYAIAILHGGVYNDRGDVTYKMAEKAAKAVMEKMNVSITFAYQREDGARTHIIIQPKKLPKHEAQAYLEERLLYSPERLKPFVLLERKLAKLSGYDRVMGDYRTVEEARRTLNGIVSILERRPFSPAEVAWHRGKTLRIGDRTTNVWPHDPNLHLLYYSEHLSNSHPENRKIYTPGTLEEVFNKLRWNGRPSDPRFAGINGAPYSYPKRPEKAAKHPPLRKTLQKMHRDAKRNALD
jgi:hypothetical protein